MPAWVKKAQLRLLFKATSDAFQAPLPRRTRLNHQALLEAYASFTAQETLRLQANDAELTQAKQRLYDNAFALGARLRTVLKISPSDAFLLIQLLYRNMEIELSGELPGTIVVSRCFFCKYYSPFVCEFISALDSGIMAGVVGEGGLVFSERITEGFEACKAVFMTGETP